MAKWLSGKVGRGRFASAAPVCLATGLLLSGCRVGGVRSVEAENDRLREEAIQHDKTVADLQGQISELKVKLAEASRNQSLTPEALEALPRVTTIELSSLCGFTPPEADKPATGVSVWFETLDGRGRFVQGVGTVTVAALVLPPDAKGEPQQVASATLTPTQLRDAYRSSFTGTHYAAELKLDKPIERGAGRTPSLVVRIEFKDAITGEVLKGERVISPKTSASPAAVRP